MHADVREALQDAMELAIENVAEIEGRVIVYPDVSASMQSPLTGHRAGSTAATRCIGCGTTRRSRAGARQRSAKKSRVIPREMGRRGID